MGDNQGLEDLIDDRQFGDFLEGEIFTRVGGIGHLLSPDHTLLFLLLLHRPVLLVVLSGFHTINQLGVQRVEFNSSRGHRGKKTRSERDASGESDGNNSSSSSSPPPSPIKEKRKVMVDG